MRMRLGHTSLIVVTLVCFCLALSWGEITGLYFTLEPSDVTVPVGGNAVFNCAARAEGHVKILWKKDGSALEINVGDLGRTVLANGSLVITPLLRPRGALVEGTYQCVATADGIGSILSRSAKLITTAPTSTARFIEEPEDITVGRRQTARFSCSIDGELHQQTNWFKNNSPLSIDRTRMTVLPSGSLEIRQVIESDEGLYNCLLPEYPPSRKGRLAVASMENAPKNVPPVFTTTPKNQVISVPSSVLFECSAVSYPLPTISWLKDGVTLDLSRVGSRFLKIGEGNLMISSVEEGDKGTYQCRAENPEDSADISATLEVNSAPVVQDGSERVRMYGFEKSDVELPCKIRGSPTPRIQWYKNGDRIIEGDYFQMNGDNLLILGLVASDGGMYQCIGMNIVGNVQSSIFLQVLKPGQTIPVANSSVDAFSPSELTPLLTSTRFITLAWKPPIRTNGKIISYTIYYKEIGSERERVVNVSNPVVEEVNVQGLQPNKTYTFRVVPHGEFGIGRTSAQIHVLTQNEMNVPGPPKFLKATPVSSTSVYVKWDPPEDFTEGTKNYKVYYSEAHAPKEYPNPNSEEEEEESEENSKPAVPIVLEVQVTNEYAILNNLKIFTEYYVWVEATNENGPGVPSEQVRVTTLSDTPSSPPTNVTMEPASTVIVLRWEPPPLHTRNGIITGYKVKYKQRGKRANTLTTDGNSRFIGLNELERGAEYQIKIAALSVNGTGPFTEWMTTATFERELDESQVPDKPNNLVAKASAEAITITWAPPHNSGSVLVRGYTIGWGKGIPDVYSKLVDGKSRHFTIEDLKANSDYVISLRAYNQVGDGIPIYENVRTRDEEDLGLRVPTTAVQFPPPVGLRAVVLSSTSVVLYWTDTTLKSVGNERRLYIVRYAPASEQQHSKAVPYKYANTTEQNLIINDLRPGVNYEFSVKVVRGRRSSEWSLVVYNRTGTSTNPTATATAEPPARFAPPKDLTLLAITGPDEISTVVLSWQPPKTNVGGEVKGYLLFYTTNPTLKEWVEETVAEDVLTHRVSGLTPDTTYYFRMSARYSKAFSTSTPTKSVSTPMAKSGHGHGHGSGAGNSGNSGGGYQDVNGGNKAPSQLLLYALIGVSLLVAAVSVFCCTYYKRRRPDDSPKRKKGSSGNSGSSKPEIKPPDLWIHHDQMGFKNIEKNQSSESHLLMQSGGSSKEFDSDMEKIPLQYNKMNSLDRSGGGGKSVSSCDTFPSSKTQQYRMTEFAAAAPGAPQGTLSRRGSNLKSFNVQDPSCEPPLPQFMQMPPQHQNVPVRSPHSGSNTTMSSPIHRLSSSLGRREPITPITAYSADQCCSNEDLSQEISNLEGLMKDLTAITASEFQC